MQVDHLTKVQVAFTAGCSPEKMDLLPEPAAWSFVAGASAEGLTPFEMACHQKTPGDEICVELPSRQSHKIFEHLRPPILNALPHDKTVFLKTVVTRVEAATSREVVQAMAEATNNGSGGCGGGCGCGCG